MISPKGSVAKLVRFVTLDAGLQPIEGEHDREADGDLCRGDRDDEEGEHLPVHVAGVQAVVSHEREIHGVQHQLDAHQLHEHVATHQKPDAAEREQRAREHDVVLDVITQHVHQMPPALAAALLALVGKGRCASRAMSGPWNMRALGPPLASRRTCGLPRATAIAPTTATIKSAVVSSKGMTSLLNNIAPMASTEPCSGRAMPNSVGLPPARDTRCAAPRASTTKKAPAP